MLLELSELLRAAVDGRRQHTTTLAEETAFVKRYIELQRTRFSDRLDVRYAISPESERCECRHFCCSRLSRTPSGTASHGDRVVSSRAGGVGGRRPTACFGS